MMRQLFSLIMLCLLSVSPTYSQHIEALNVITVDNLTKLQELPIEQDSLIPARKLIFYPSDDFSLEAYKQFENKESSRYQIVFIRNDYPGEISYLNVDDFIFSPDRTLAAVVHNINEIQVLDIRKNNSVLTLKIETNGEPLNTIAIDSQNRYLAVGVGGPELYPVATSIFQLFDLASGERIITFNRLTSNADEISASGVVFDSTGDYVYLSTSDGTIRQWNISTEQEQIIGDGAIHGYGVAVYNRSINFLAFLKSNGFRIIENENISQDVLASTEMIQKSWWLMTAIVSHVSEPLIAIAYIIPEEPISEKLDRINTIQVWNLETGELGFETEFSDSFPDNVINIIFNLNGTLLGSISTDGTVRLWGIPAGE